MRLCTTLFVAFSTLTLSAQIGRKELRTDSGLIVLHHFKNGGISTREWRDKDDRFGRSIAYDPNGGEIFSYQTRRIGGHASAHFSYHPNGGVSKVEVSDAPDGGIQWYRSTTTFDEAGNRTGFTEDGRDNYGPLTGPGRLDVRNHRPHVITEPPKQEVAECQKMFVNEVFVVNPTTSACRVTATAKQPSPALTGGTYTMAPGDTLRLGTYSKGEVFPEPGTEVDLDIVQVELGNTRKPVAGYHVEQVSVSAEHRRHYVIIEVHFTPSVPPGEEHLPGLPLSPKKKGGKPRKRFGWRFW